MINELQEIKNNNIVPMLEKLEELSPGYISKQISNPGEKSIFLLFKEGYQLYKKHGYDITKNKSMLGSVKVPDYVAALHDFSDDICCEITQDIPLDVLKSYDNDYNILYVAYKKKLYKTIELLTQKNITKDYFTSKIIDSLSNDKDISIFWSNYNRLTGNKDISENEYKNIYKRLKNYSDFNNTKKDYNELNFIKLFKLYKDNFSVEQLEKILPLTFKFRNNIYLLVFNSFKKKGLTKLDIIDKVWPKLGFCLNNYNLFYSLINKDYFLLKNENSNFIDIFLKTYINIKNDTHNNDVRCRKIDGLLFNELTPKVLSENNFYIFKNILYSPISYNKDICSLLNRVQFKDSEELSQIIDEKSLLSLTFLSSNSKLNLSILQKENLHLFPIEIKIKIFNNILSNLPEFVRDSDIKNSFLYRLYTHFSDIENFDWSLINTVKNDNEIFKDIACKKLNIELNNSLIKKDVKSKIKI